MVCCRIDSGEHDMNSELNSALGDRVLKNDGKRNWRVFFWHDFVSLTWLRRRKSPLLKKEALRFHIWLSWQAQC